LVSHDRRFLDNIVTQTIAAEGGGRWREYVGGYSDWLVQKSASAAARAAGAPSSFAAAQAPAPAAARAAPTPGTRAKSRLGYKDQRELDALPKQIEALEQEQSALLVRMSSGDYSKSSSEVMRADSARASAIEQEMSRKFARWQALEELRLKP
jgi:ATP-binding cassette subfamily F protein uup